jgi:hypothetical protein
MEKEEDRKENANHGTIDEREEHVGSGESHGNGKLEGDADNANHGVIGEEELNEDNIHQGIDREVGGSVMMMMMI